jgi:ABC-type sugar transport system permease subunit
MQSTVVVAQQPSGFKRAKEPVLEPTIFLGPKVILFAAFVLVPFLYTFILMFQAGTLIGGFRFVGLENFRTISEDPLFFRTLRNTLLYTLLYIPLVLTVPLAVGTLLASSIRGVRYYRTLIYVPSLLSIVATGLIWRMMLHPDVGPLYRLVNVRLGLDVPWLSDGNAALVFIVLVSLWQSLGFYSIVFMAGLNDIDTTLFEAARVDGATDWTVFWSIKLPLLKPVFQLVLVLSTISAIQVFDIIFVMTQGGPGTSTYTTMWYIYQNVFNYGAIGYAAAMGAVMLVGTLVIAVLYMRATRSDAANG